MQLLRDEVEHSLLVGFVWVLLLWRSLGVLFWLVMLTELVQGLKSEGDLFGALV